MPVRKEVNCMLSMIQAYVPKLKREEGQGLVEYGLIIALVALAVTATLILLGGALDDLFVSVTNAI